MKSQIQIHHWNEIPYEEAHSKQKELVARRISGDIPNTFVFCSHPPTITLGRVSKRKPLVLTPGSVLETTPQIYVERGGEATYHGPGQLVVYPIVKIFPASQQVARPYRGVANLIRAMEAALHELCQSYGVKTCSLPGETGVWTDTSETPHLQKKKLASIGIAVTKWVTYHGLALNFSVDPAVWRAFNPCGYSGEVMSDLETEAQQKIDAKKLIENFEKIINLHF